MGQFWTPITPLGGSLLHADQQKELDYINKYIDQVLKTDSYVEIMGVNTLPVIQAISKTLDQYISPGIGYARSIKSVVDYLENYPLTR